MVAQLPETYQVEFETQLNRTFSDWVSIEQPYKADMALKLQVDVSQLTLSAREGSIIITNTADVADTTNTSLVVQDLQQQAQAGTLTLGGALVSSMTQPISLVSTGASIVVVDDGVVVVSLVG